MATNVVIVFDKTKKEQAVRAVRYVTPTGLENIYLVIKILLSWAWALSSLRTKSSLRKKKEEEEMTV